MTKTMSFFKLLHYKQWIDDTPINDKQSEQDTESKTNLGLAETVNGNEISDSGSSTNLIAKKETSCLTITMSSTVVVALVVTFLILGRDYIKYLLLSVEDTNLWIGFAVFMFMFTLISFPMTWGYILLNVAAGYLYGVLCGTLVTMVCGLYGLSLATLVIKTCLRNFVMSHLENEHILAIMKVVDSDSGFKVVILSRLTPIPFGLQNAIYAMSSMSYIRYAAASVIGMFPAQCMYSYVGSTLRSMEEVIYHTGSKPTAYILFLVQLSLISLLLLYIITRAKTELKNVVNAPKKSNSATKMSAEIV